MRDPVPPLGECQGDGDVATVPFAVFHLGEIERSQHVCLVDGGLREKSLVIPAVGITAIGVPAGLGKIGHAVGPSAVGSLDDDRGSVRVVELEGGVHLRQLFLTVAPDGKRAVSRNHGIYALRGDDAVFLRIMDVVAQVHPCHIDVVVGCVVEFHPVVPLPVFADVDVVSCRHLVDANGCSSGLVTRSLLADSLVLGLYLIDSRLLCVAQAEGFLVAQEGVLHPRQREVAVPEDVRRSKRYIVYLHGNHVLALVQHGGIYLEGTFVGNVASPFTGDVRIDGSLRAAVSAHIDSVHINAETVVHLVTEGDDAVVVGLLVKHDFLAEIVGGTFVVRVSAVVQGRVEHRRHGHTAVGVAERRQTARPARVVVRQRFPVLSVQRAAVVVVPVVAPVYERLHIIGGCPLQHPAGKRVSGRSLCRERNRLEEIAFEPACGHLLTVHQQSAFADVAFQGDLVATRQAEVVLHVVYPAAVVGVADGTYHVGVRRVALEPECSVHRLVHRGNDFATTPGLEEAAVHQAEGVDELLLEGLVLDERAEQVVHVGSPGGADKVAYHVVRIPGRVEVEDHEVEFPVVGTRAETLHVVGVRNPVATADVALEGHVVDVLVDVEPVAHLAVRLGALGPCQVRGQRKQFFPGHVVAHLLVVLGVAQVKLVHVVGIDTVVAVSEVLVVRLAYVQHSQVVAVDEHVGGLPVLAVDVEARRQGNHLQVGVLRAGVGVVASVPHLQAMVLVVRLMGEDGIVEVLLPLVAFVALQAEARLHFPVLAVHHASAPGSRPSAGYLEVALLVQHALVLTSLSAVEGDHVLHVNGAFPVHVPVLGRPLPVAGYAVGARHIDANLVVEEVGGLGDDAQDGQIVVVVPVDERAGDHGARQITVLQQDEAIDDGAADGELARRAGAAVTPAGGASVGGVAQGGPFGDVHAKG